ncbi:Zinc finger CCCH domain-containing protein 4 [Heterocephalus glaber]|uniref:Zinc finger CCCH domain-containing protein 4 n=1 Tax=Heterocephalus glaber TaxID=10181 RepID=G5BCP8_HETGA|nr:Zinc finger CCCH domain-containing protein 4 [Heterocephalus glaber]
MLRGKEDGELEEGELEDDGVEDTQDTPGGQERSWKEKGEKHHSDSDEEPNGRPMQSGPPLPPPPPPPPAGPPQMPMPMHEPLSPQQLQQQQDKYNKKIPSLFKIVVQPTGQLAEKLGVRFPGPGGPPGPMGPGPNIGPPGPMGAPMHPSMHPDMHPDMHLDMHSDMPMGPGMNLGLPEQQWAGDPCLQKVHATGGQLPDPCLSRDPRLSGHAEASSGSGPGDTRPSDLRLARSLPTSKTEGNLHSNPAGPSSSKGSGPPSQEEEEEERALWEKAMDISLDPLPGHPLRDPRSQLQQFSHIKKDVTLSKPSFARTVLWNPEDLIPLPVPKEDMVVPVPAALQSMPALDPRLHRSSPAGPPSARQHPGTSTDPSTSSSNLPDFEFLSRILKTVNVPVPSAAPSPSDKPSDPRVRKAPTDPRLQKPADSPAAASAAATVTTPAEGAPPQPGVHNLPVPALFGTAKPAPKTGLGSPFAGNSPAREGEQDAGSLKDVFKGFDPMASPFC